MLTLEMPNDLSSPSIPFTPSPDADAAADLLDTPTPAESTSDASEDYLPGVDGSGGPENSNGHAATLAKHDYWLVFPRPIYHELIAMGVEIQSQSKASDTHDRIYCRCTDEVKSAVESRFAAELKWEESAKDGPLSTAGQLEPLCEQPDCEDSKTIVVGQAGVPAAESTPMIVDPNQPPKSENRPSIADKLRSSESRLLECSLEIYECELKVESAKDRLRLLREVMAEQAAEVQRLRSGIDDYATGDDEDDEDEIDTELTPPGADTDAAKAATGPDSPPAAVDSATAATVDPSTWRTIPTIRVCNEPDSIKGLGAGKLATVVEKYPALGDLEDARVAAGTSGLHSVLPNGCGKGIGEALTDRIIHWLTKTRDAAVFAELTGVPPAEVSPAAAVHVATAAEIVSDPPAEKPKKARKTKGSGATAQKELPRVAEPVTAPAAAAHTAAASTTTITPIPTSEYMTSAQWSCLTDPQQQAAITARAATINTGKPNCLDPKHASSKFWESGYEANGRMVEGEPLKMIDLPYVPGPEADDWLRGWLSKDAINNYEGKGAKEKAEKVEKAKEPAATPTKSPQPQQSQPQPALTSLDDLL